MNEQYFNNLLLELVDENPFAIRAVLKILRVEFTSSVPTCAVTIESQPGLLINLSFLGKHCRTDLHCKAVIIHEFLHVLLRHTEQSKPMTPARHLAFDAIINAIIHRQFGADYSGMMSRYYAESEGLQKLLRPMNALEQRCFYEHGLKAEHPAWVLAWDALYEGKLISDDIEALVGDINNSDANGGRGTEPFTLDPSAGNDTGTLLGNHDAFDQALSEELKKALGQSLREMNGSGIWRNPREHGVGANPYEASFSSQDDPLVLWKRKTMRVLKQYLQPDKNSTAHKDVAVDYQLPVLTTSDRRAFMRSIWDSFIPPATGSTTLSKPAGSAQIYLDVSGSMNREMPLLITLLWKLKRYIKRPFWAFSDVVAPAVIEKGLLKADTTGGTSMSCVLEHIAQTRPSSAVVFTDGYIETVDRKLLEKTATTRLHVIITRDGSASVINRTGIPYTQLDEVPA